MLCHAPGVCSGSDFYFPTPSERARKFLYYMMTCGHFFCDLHYYVERDDYASYLLFYIVKGRLSLTTRGRKYIASDGDIAFLNCHEPHEYHALSMVEFEFIHFDGAQAAVFYEEFYNEIGVVAPAPADCIVSECLSTFLSTFRNEQQLSEVKISAMLYNCLCGLLTVSQSDPFGNIGNSQIQAAVDYIKAHSTEQLTLHQIADVANLSPYYFSRQFKRQTGYSPYEFTIICRINAAKHLLKTTDDTIKQIAFKVGYNSENSFTNSFTLKVGISPRQFRSFQF